MRVHRSGLREPETDGGDIRQWRASLARSLQSGRVTSGILSSMIISKVEVKRSMGLMPVMKLKLYLFLSL